MRSYLCLPRARCRIGPGRCVAGDRRIPGAARDEFRGTAADRHREPPPAGREGRRLRPVLGGRLRRPRLRGAGARWWPVQETRHGAMGRGVCDRASPRFVSRRPSGSPARRNPAADHPLGARVRHLATNGRAATASVSRTRATSSSPCWGCWPWGPMGSPNSPLAVRRSSAGSRRGRPGSPSRSG